MFLCIGLTWNIPAGSPAGLPDGIATLAEALHPLGYSTAMSGVWDLGHSQWKLTPTGKGFDQYAGSFMVGSDPLTKSYYDVPWHELGKDWINVFADGQTIHMSDMRPVHDAVTDEAQRMIKSHFKLNSEKPLFLYVSYTTAAPLESENVRCKDILHVWRRQHCAAMVSIDEGVGAIAATAQDKLGDDTIFIFTSTNGASVLNGGLNMPFRGAAGSLLEGGVRVPAFVVDFSLDGRYLGAGSWIYNGMTHISDWFPTILSVVKGSLSSYTNAGGDGLDMSVTLKYYRDRKPHRDLVLLEMHENQDPGYDFNSAAIISGDMKLIEGIIREHGFYREPISNNLEVDDFQWSLYVGEKLMQALEYSIGSARLRPFKKYLSDKLMARATEGTFLFNITADPEERYNLANAFPDQIGVLREKIIMHRRLRKLPQRHHSLQINDSAARNALVAGECSFNADTAAQIQCLYVHPWCLDNENPYSASLVNSLQLIDERVVQISIIASITAIVVSITTMIAILRVFFRKSVSPSAVIKWPME